LTKFDIGLQDIGFTFEPRLSNTITTDLSLGFGGGYDISALVRGTRNKMNVLNSIKTILSK
jgi:hypothetical protein